MFGESNQKIFLILIFVVTYIVQSLKSERVHVDIKISDK